MKREKKTLFQSSVILIRRGLLYKVAGAINKTLIEIIYYSLRVDVNDGMSNQRLWQLKRS